ncbi:MAG: zinc-binding protein [Dehalococcoidia bacterium]|nr:zinc-binding protein [Dehalococcoidia bacterium]
MSFTDRVLVCADCGSEFVFSAGEQAFFAEKGFTNEPKRCVSCRSQRRQQRSGYGGGDTGYDYESSPRPPRQMFPIICDGCGAEAEVPFQPRGDRPVYCRDCFSRHRESSWS